VKEVTILYRRQQSGGAKGPHKGENYADDLVCTYFSTQG
jgi:hypothetical protein